MKGLLLNFGFGGKQGESLKSGGGGEKAACSQIKSEGADRIEGAIQERLGARAA
jgi:hypothetical protein